MAAQVPPLNESIYFCNHWSEVMKKRELDNMLDQITTGIRSEQIDDAAANEASDRVWSRMNGASRMLADRPNAHPNAAAALGTSGDAGAPTIATIEGCADFQSL